MYTICILYVYYVYYMYIYIDAAGKHRHTHKHRLFWARRHHVSAGTPFPCKVSHYAVTAPDLRAVVLNLSPRLQPPELFRPSGLASCQGIMEANLIINNAR